MISCPNCGKDIDDDAAHCGHCGHKIEVKSKKTIMGFGGAVDPDALRSKLDKAKKKDKGGQGGPKIPRPPSQGGSKLPRPSGSSDGADAPATGEEAPDMAPTQLMDSVDLPTPEGEDGGEAAASDFETAPTEMMDQPEASDFDEFEDDDGAFAATKAMSTVESPKVTEPAEEEAGKGGSDTGGRWQIGDTDDEGSGSSDDAGDAMPSPGEGGIEIDLGEVEGGGVVVDEGQPSNDGAGQAVEDTQGPPAGGRDLMQMRKGGGGEVEASDGDSGAEGDSVAGMDDYLEEGEDDEGPDQKLLIGGAVALLVLGCCGISCVSGLIFL